MNEEIADGMNMQRGEDAIQRAGSFAGLPRLNPRAPISRTVYVPNTYLPKICLYNAILIGDLKILEELHIEACRRIFRTIQRSKEKGINKVVVARLVALFKITPVKQKPQWTP